MKMRFVMIMVLMLVLCPLVSTKGRAAESAAPAIAEDISGTEIVTDQEGFSNVYGLFDGKLLEGTSTGENASITFTCEDGIGSLYLIFDRACGTYTITDNATQTAQLAGTYGYIHEFLDLTQIFGYAPQSVTLSFQSPATIFEIQVYTEGEVPDSVQKWEPPADGKADLVLFSTHGDDEQLFFAGVLPYYAKERGYTVQVVYFTDHPEETHRMHEMLNGLWAVGVTCYPVFGDHPDFFERDLSNIYAIMNSYGFDRDTLLEFVVENIRRFRPQVAVGHDIQGEYGHAMHMMYTDLLMEAVTISADPTYAPGSAEAYGTWDVPKTYLHLYEENQIVMDWDQPLASFDGMTAFEVTKELGYPCHKSQYRDFAWYLSYYDTAADCPKYNPCYYGLFRSTVGEDVEKNDFFENVLTHGEMAQIEEEARLEAERLAAEEEARRAEEQAQQEEAARRAEAAQHEAEMQQAAEAAAAQTRAERKQRIKLIVAVALEAGLVVSLIVLAHFIVRRKKAAGKK